MDRNQPGRWNGRFLALAGTAVGGAALLFACGLPTAAQPKDPDFQPRRVLEQIPSVMTDWKSWSRAHPDGAVVLLSRTSKEYQREFYRRPEQFVLGIAEGGKARAWTFDALARTPAVNDQWDGQPVVVLFDRESVTARLYSRKLKDRELTFEAAGDRIRDKETGSTWEPATGRATAGPLEGQYLTALPAIVSYRDAWMKFHPRSEIAPPRAKE